MLTLTLSRRAAGWRYRQAGYYLNEYSVVRKINWDVPDSVPLWHVICSDELMHTTEHLDDAMNFVEATHELEQAE